MKENTYFNVLADTFERYDSMGFNASMHDFETCSMIEYSKQSAPASFNNMLQSESYEYTASLHCFAYVVAMAVLKHLHKVSGSDSMDELRNGLYYGMRQNIMTHCHSDNLHTTRITRYGDVRQKRDHETSEKLEDIKDTYQDGMDLLQEAVYWLKYYSEESLRLYGVVDMERTNVIVKLNKQTFINKVQDLQHVKDETVYIQRVFRALCEYIRSMYGITENKYIYLEYQDEDSPNIYYVRYPSYVGVVKHNGTTYYGTETTTRQYEIWEQLTNKLASLNLTAREQEILQLKQEGYSHEMVRKKLGLKSKGGITKHLRNIACKLLKAGFLPDGLSDYILNNNLKGNDLVNVYVKELINKYFNDYLIEDETQTVFEDPTSVFERKVKDVTYKTIEDEDINPLKLIEITYERLNEADTTNE